MRKSSPKKARRSVLLACAILLCAVALIAKVPLRGAEILDEIHASWQKRTNSIKSFRYECRLEELLAKASRNLPAHRRAKKNQLPAEVPNVDAVLQRIVTCSMAGEKIAYSEDGEEWDDSTNRIRAGTYKVAFDARNYRQLVTGSTASQPKVAQGELADKNNSGALASSLTLNVNQTAFWLWYSANDWLERRGYPPSTCKVNERRDFRDGRECVVASLRTSVPSAWKMMLYLDPVRDYLPLQMVLENDGIVRCDLSIQYAKDEKVGWRVSAWKDESFGKTGANDKSVSVEVTHFLVNEPLDDDLFTFEFPEGTQFQETSAAAPTKYYVALASGGRKEIAKREFGRPPALTSKGNWTRVTLIVVSAAVVAVLILAAVTLRMRRKGVSL